MDIEFFLKGIFKGLLGREPEPEAIAYLADQFAKGRPYEELIHEVASSPECRLRYSKGFVPSGHFYSPICDPDQLARHFQDPSLVSIDTLIPGVRLNPEKQLKLWELWRPMLANLPFPEEKDGAWRYHYHNEAFGSADAAVLHCMLRWLQPRRYVEIGSGYSSACALDTIERFLDRRVQPTFIDPYIETLKGLLHAGDESWITEQALAVQEIEPSFWESLDPGDILFVDSSHVVKSGSDVLTILFEIMPRLKSGVVVQFHDVIFPFDYPKSWVIDENRSWNEVYALRAFLTNNTEWEVLFFNNYFYRMAPRLVTETCPPYARHGGGSLWLRRV